MLTKESKIAATERLRKEGRLEEGNLFRDQVRKRLRAEGKGRAEAVDESWIMMIEKFPPLPAVELNEELGEEPDVVAFVLSNDEFEFPPDAEQSTDQVAADCRWVYRNVARQTVTKKDAASAGAWGLLMLARKNQGKFYEQIVTKIASGKFGASEGALVSESNDDTSEIDDLLNGAYRSETLECPNCKAKLHQFARNGKTELILAVEK